MTSSPKIIPVIHYLSDDLALKNAEMAFGAGCDGVFLIAMDGRNEPLLRVAQEIKRAWPARLVGINYLGMDPVSAIETCAGGGLDMTWSDCAQTHSRQDLSAARVIADELCKHPGHLFFGGVAFKYQAPEPDPAAAAVRAADLGMIPTTSGSATGVAADVGKIKLMREALGDRPLAIASGITPENVRSFSPFLSHVLVATGVSRNEHSLDFELLCVLVSQVRARF